MIKFVIPALIGSVLGSSCFFFGAFMERTYNARRLETAVMALEKRHQATCDPYLNIGGFTYAGKELVVCREVTGGVVTHQVKEVK